MTIELVLVLVLMLGIVWSSGTAIAYSAMVPIKVREPGTCGPCSSLPSLGLSTLEAYAERGTRSELMEVLGYHFLPPLWPLLLIYRCWLLARWFVRNTRRLVRTTRIVAQRTVPELPKLPRRKAVESQEPGPTSGRLSLAHQKEVPRG